MKVMRHISQCKVQVTCTRDKVDLLRDVLLGGREIAKEMGGGEGSRWAGRRRGVCVCRQPQKLMVWHDYWQNFLQPQLHA